jgi:hypothetical protein
LTARLRAHGIPGFILGADSRSGLNLSISVEYFASLQTESGKTLARAFLHLEVRDQCAQQTILDERCTNEIITRPHGSKEEKTRYLTSTLADSAVSATAHLLTDRLTVIATATAPSGAGAKTCEERAKMMALRAACEKAWGIELFAETSVKDLTDVNSIVQSKANGHVLQCDVLGSSGGADSTSCTVTVRAVLSRQK